MLDARKIDPRTGQPWANLADRDVFINAVANGHASLPDGYEVAPPDDVDASVINPTTGQPWANPSDRDNYVGAVALGFIKLPAGYMLPPPPPPEANSVKLRRMLVEWNYNVLVKYHSNDKPADFDKTLAAYNEEPDAPLFD